MRRMHIYGGGLLATLGLLATMAAPSTAGVKVPDPALDDTPATTKGNATLVLAGGCFWGIEEVYQHVRGVVDAVSGYAGGSARTASYDMVSTGTSGHAESVKITYDPSKVTLGTLLKVFFSVAHDPTLLNRQGPDVGPQDPIGSLLFQRPAATAGEELHRPVEQRARLQVPIVTQLVPLTAFYKAEEDHQDYAVKNPFNRYILINDKPKVDDLKREFPALYK